MNAIHKRRLYFIVFILVVVSIVVALTLYALKQNINLFYTPTQIGRGEIVGDRLFRLGGQVKLGTIKQGKNPLQVSFVVSDSVYEVPVEYQGVLPDLFREGQSVVVEGRLNSAGIIQAIRVLAKHDERYKPVYLKK
jgi:cytochrome c-type biogenesis protein CcmE